ncbi:MAG: GNAT family N-acetyltransferase [Pikeienuella sp.]
MEIQKARPEDAIYLRRIALAAYQPYVARIGKKPAPMQADFVELIGAGEVWSISEIGDILGYIVMRETGGSLHIENVAVAPEHHGQGLGRALLEFAEDEAQRRKLPRMELYTNALMRENLVLYTVLGWREYDRRHEEGFDRVYFERMVSGSG